MKFLEKFNIEFKNKKLLEVALTHSSYANEHRGCENYERLEFLGDAVLEVVTSEYFYLNTDFKEGQMTKLRANYVCEKALATYAKEIGIDTSGKIWIQAGQAWIFHQCFHYHLAEYPFKCRSLIFMVAVTKHLIPFSKPYKVNDFMKGHSQCALFTVEEKHLKPLLF